MAHYESLKDYMQLNHLDVISEAIYDYIRTSSNVKLRINDLKILTQDKIIFMPSDIMVQSEITFSPFDSLTFILGISCEESDEDNNSVGVYYYKVMLTGNMSKRFSDLYVFAVEECTQDSLPMETVTAMFGLPDIVVDNLEEEAEKIHHSLCKRIKCDNEHRFRLPVVRIKEKFRLKMWPADLPEECLGQIRFEESSATIYDINDPYTPHLNCPIPANTILLNVKYYRNEIGCDDIITATHELIHWEIHLDYMRLLQFLDDSYKVMECKTVPIPLDNNMSLKEKARWYAEWQANELAIRVAMPKHLVEEAIEEYNNDESVHSPADVPFSGRYYQNMIYKISWDFNVPQEIMRLRFRQLGYDFADGVRYTAIDGMLMPPFTFPRGTLKENETFVIDRANYERLLGENTDFAELITSRICVYTGYVVCLYDAKYVKPAINNGQVSYELTDYAREHAHECCLFYTLSSSHIISNYTFYGQKYLCNEADGAISEYSYDKDGNLIISRKIETIIDRRKKDAQLYDDINSEGIKEFSVALTYIMDKLELTKKIVAERIGCNEKTIQNYRNSQTPDSIEKVLLCCLGCQTGPKVSRFFIEKSVGGIPDVGLKRTAYEFLLENTNATLEIWNNVLKEFHLPPIYM